MPLLIDLPIAAQLLDVFAGVVMALFTISAILLTIVILLQEGKGGGLAGAFGGAGAEAFGVKAGTVNTFTAWLGAAFLGLALLHAGLQRADNSGSIEDDGERPTVIEGEELVPADGSGDGDSGDDGDSSDGDTAPPALPPIEPGNGDDDE